eukprot:573303-Rhodomonas_salina.1
MAASNHRCAPPVKGQMSGPKSNISAHIKCFGSSQRLRARALALASRTARSNAFPAQSVPGSNAVPVQRVPGTGGKRLISPSMMTGHVW